MNGVLQKFMPWLIVLLVGSFAIPVDVLAQDSDMDSDSPPVAVSLDTPPLPKLDKGEWKSEKDIFTGALYVTDAQDNQIGKPIDLPGTKYAAHLEYRRQMDALDDDRLNRIASDYEKALTDNGFDYQIGMPDSSWKLAGDIADSADGGVAGQLAIVGGNLRFVAVRTSESGGDGGDEAGQQPQAKEIDVSGDVEIFVSDIIPVLDLAQKIAAMNKTPVTEAVGQRVQ
jgi:hypothetical protein